LIRDSGQAAAAPNPGGYGAGFRQPVNTYGQMASGMGVPMNPNPMYGQGNPMYGQGNPMYGQGNPMYGQGNPMYGQGNPMYGQGNPMYGQGNPMYGQGNPMYGQGNPMYGQGNPMNGQWSPMNGQGNGQGIYQTMGEMESLRKSIFSRYIMIGIVPAVMLIFFIFLSGYTRSRGVAPLTAILLMVGMLIPMAGMKEKKQKLKRLYKETFVCQLLQQRFQNVLYTWETGWTAERVKSTGLVRLGNRFHSEDYLTAIWRGVRFEQSDVEVKYHTSSGKSSHTTIYFRGRMFCFDYVRKQTTPVQIHTKNFFYSGDPMYGVKMQKVELEDVDFNKRFAVKALNPHDAFYVLTPQFMMRLKQLEDMYNSVTIVIKDGKLYVGLNNRMDAFDANIMKPIEYVNEKERVEKDVQVIEILIELLNCLP
ncbi:MAG: DUF3137 domain-containing protein, partial [Eubacterium sp.]|nr:DUF3137 domain-containing protein [Eubacterium sp.]